jgi:hypothetical protein
MHDVLSFPYSSRDHLSWKNINSHTPKPPHTHSTTSSPTLTSIKSAISTDTYWIQFLIPRKKSASSHSQKSLRRQENMDTERESTPKRKGFLTSARTYIVKIARGPTKTNINTRQMDSEMQNHNLMRVPSNKSSMQETTTTVCNSKEEEEANAVSVKTADENVQGEIVDMR